MYSDSENWLKQRQEDKRMIKYIYDALSPSAGQMIPFMIYVKLVKSEALRYIIINTTYNWITYQCNEFWIKARTSN